MRVRPLLLRAALAALPVVAWACGSPAGPSDPGSESWRIARLGGHGQEAQPGVELSTALSVVIRDRDGAPVPAAAIHWTVVSGAGQFLPSATTLTDANGVSAVRFIPEAYRVIVEATAAGPAGPVTVFETVPPLAGIWNRVSNPGWCPAPGCERLRVYADSSFGLRYASGVEFDGTLSRSGAVVTLAFTAPGWWAQGVLRGGDSLDVTYNAEAQLSDFENATFVLDPAALLRR